MTSISVVVAGVGPKIFALHNAQKLNFSAEVCRALADALIEERDPAEMYRRLPFPHGAEEFGAFPDLVEHLVVLAEQRNKEMPFAQKLLEHSRGLKLTAEQMVRLEAKKKAQDSEMRAYYIRQGETVIEQGRY